MKHHFCIFIVMLWAASSTFAQSRVDEQQARTAAAQYAATIVGTEAPKLSLAATYPNSDGTGAALYVYNISPQGYVVIAATESIHPVVAYSDRGHFDSTTLAPAMKWILGEHIESITAAQKAKPTPESIALWKEGAKRFSSKSIITLTSSVWDQDYPYNNLCPRINGVTPSTGCQACALAQVLYYWRYPRIGQGQVSYNSSYAGNLSANFGQSVYRYELMQDDMRGVTDPAAIEAVGVLNRDCGLAVHMEYTLGGSGSEGTTYVAYALKNYFKYDEELHIVKRNERPFANYSGEVSTGDTLWCDTLSHEILAGRPVLYGGADESGMGHAFVVDGYNTSTGLFRINWGWGYQDPIWYNFHTSAITYKVAQIAFIGVQPPADSLTLSVPEVGRTADTPTLRIYPNPATQTVNVAIANQETPTPTRIEIIDLTGRTVLATQTTPSETHRTLNISSLKKGVYTVRVGPATTPLIIQ